MFDYVIRELPGPVEANLPLLPGVESVSGHPTGEHGALIYALKQPGAYRSVSTFAPIANPLNCGWGQTCCGAYLGDDASNWEAYDATGLVQGGARASDIPIDQGDADEFLQQGQLLPDKFQAACDAVDQSGTIRMQPGYAHSYHVIASFIEDHIDWLAKALKYLSSARIPARAGFGSQLAVRFLPEPK